MNKSLRVHLNTVTGSIFLNSARKIQCKQPQDISTEIKLTGKGSRLSVNDKCWGSEYCRVLIDLPGYAGTDIRITVIKMDEV